MGVDFSDVSLATEERRIREILDGDDAYGWMIQLDGQVIGAIEINRIQESSGQYGAAAASMSILIGDRQRWGRRIAPHAESAVWTGPSRRAASRPSWGKPSSPTSEAGAPWSGSDSNSSRSGQMFLITSRLNGAYMS
jgi:hypothetical protein